MGVTERLARLVVETPAERLIAPALLESAKLRLLDGLAIMLAGSREPSTLIALAMAREWGGAAAAGVVGHPDRLPAPLAGFVNGVSAHSQEFDDYTRGAGHMTVSMVPGSLAAAEEAGLSGRALVEGFVVGFEVVCRIARGMNPYLFDRGFHQNCLWAELGVAAAAARMRGLSVDETRMALGIACSGGSGIRRNVGSMGKAYHVGHGVMNGLVSASLAGRGYVVDPEAVAGEDEPGHGRWGLVETYNGIGNYALGKTTAGLGEAWELEGNRTVVCFHPGSTTLAAAVDCVIELIRAHGIRSEAVERVALDCTPEALNRACYREVESSYKARYSLPYAVAVTLIDGKAGLAQFADARVAKGDVQALMRRIEVAVPPDLAHHVGPWEGKVNWAEMRIAIHMKDGRVIRGARSHAKGWPEDVPVGFEEVAGKFADCAEGVLSPARRDRVITMVRRIERLADIRELMAAVGAEGA
ncbi:MAG: MmgE/PrpD family protein [Proteobacteria bacterium]|nr:MmgE/PrpD family protein [Pseudomonadota bacterium]